MLGSELGDIKELKQKATGVRNLGRYSQALNMFDLSLIHISEPTRPY